MTPLGSSLDSACVVPTRNEYYLVVDTFWRYLFSMSTCYTIPGMIYQGGPCYGAPSASGRIQAAIHRWEVSINNVSIEWLSIGCFY